MVACSFARVLTSPVPPPPLTIDATCCIPVDLYPSWLSVHILSCFGTGWRTRGRLIVQQVIGAGMTWWQTSGLLMH